MNNNPTALEMLFMDEDSILYMHPYILSIFESKDKFLSKKCYYSYMIYAEDQIRRAKSCTKKW